MPYNLPNYLLPKNPTILLVGAGGTGGFLAESLCRLFTGRDLTLILVDHDIVEPHNLLRQNFFKADIDKYKSEALAHRLAANFDIEIGFVPQPFNNHLANQTFKDHFQSHFPNLLIGCVDNAAARQDMNDYVIKHTNRSWLIDAGNGLNWGQVLIGNTDQQNHYTPSFSEETCYYLPTPLTQRPDLLNPEMNSKPDVDCAAALELLDQDPTINQHMAAVITQFVYRIATGKCPFMSLYVDLELGTQFPTYATPENVDLIYKAKADS